MDLETGLYHDDPEFDHLVDQLSSELFQISSTNGKVSEALRKAAKYDGFSTNILDQVHENQMRFRILKPQIEQLQVIEDPSQAQKYTQRKIVEDFGALFIEFKRLQELVLEQSKQQAIHEHDLAGSLPADEALSSRSVIELDTADNYGSEQTTALEQLVNEDEVRYQEGLVAEREQEIENIAQGMNELNEIYTNLGSIVREQGLTLDNIESNLYNVNDSTRMASSELTKAARYQRRQTGRNLCFLIILLVLSLVIVIAVKA